MVKVECEFLWQAQYLVKVDSDFSWQAQYLLKMESLKTQKPPIKV